MKKAEVEIGAVYIAKVSGKLARVQIIGITAYGGWYGLNLDTGRDVLIRGAQRLRRLVNPPQQERKGAPRDARTD